MWYPNIYSPTIIHTHTTSTRVEGIERNIPKCPRLLMCHVPNILKKVRSTVFLYVANGQTNRPTKYWNVASLVNVALMYIIYISIPHDIENISPINSFKLSNSVEAENIIQNFKNCSAWLLCKCWYYSSHCRNVRLPVLKPQYAINKTYWQWILSFKWIT